MRFFAKVLVLGLVLSCVTEAASLPGFLKRLIPSGLGSHRSKTVAQSEFQPAQAPGMVVSNVNVFNGQPSYQIPLMGISAHGAIGWSLALAYSGGVQPILAQPNSRSPAGSVGLGWSLSLPFVAVDHKGTVTSSDDVLFCNLGPYGGGQIVQNKDKVFYLSTNPYVRIFPSIQDNQFKSWLFVFPDGNKLYLGESENTRRIQRYLGSKIVAHPETAAKSGAFIYRWDVSRFTNFMETSSIYFEFAQTLENVSSVGYTRESQPSKIYWKDASGQEVESIAFEYGQLNPSEYDGYAQYEPRDSQKLFDTRYLSKLVHKQFGKNYRTVSLSYGQFAKNAAEPKRLLTNVSDQMVGGQQFNWTLSYDVNNTQMLSRIEKPDHTTENFEYSSLTFINSDAKSPSIPDTLRRDNGIVIEVPEGKEDKWTNSIFCTQQFCFAQATDATDENNVVKYLQAYQNSGNYFRKIGQLQYWHAKDLTFNFSGEYFIVASSKSRVLHFYEWDGNDFVPLDSKIGGIFQHNNLLSGEIESVFTEENYALIVTKEGDVRRVFPVLRNATTGEWSVLDMDKNTCGFANTGSYGESIRDLNSTACLEWSGAINIATSPDMFLVGAVEKDVINVFGMQETAFIDLSKSLDLFPDLGLQKIANGLTYTMNFQKNLEGLQMSGNVLIMELNDKDGNDLTVVLLYDGQRFIKSQQYKWDDGTNENGSSRFQVSGNFMLEVSYAKANVYLWRKKQINGNIVFERDDSGIFSFNKDSEKITASLSGDAFYLEASYDNQRPVIAADGSRYRHKLVLVPNDPILPIVDWTNSLDPKTTGLQFSHSDPIVFYNTRSTSDQGFCKKDGLCYVGNMSASRNFDWSKGTFFLSKTSVNWGYSMHTAKPEHWTVSSPNRLMARSVVDDQKHRILLSLVQYSGDNYMHPNAYPVVSRYWRGVETGTADEKKNQYAYFKYGIDSSIVEFNANSLSAQFMSPTMTIKDFSTHREQSKTAFNFVVDRIGEPLQGYMQNLQGSLRSQKQYDASGLKRSYSRSVFAVDSGFGRNWPEGMALNRVDTSVTVSYDQRGSKQKTISTAHLIDTLSGLPRVSVQNTGYQYLVSQSLLESQSFLVNGTDRVTFRVPVQQVNYSPLTNDPTTVIKGAAPSNILFPNNVAATSKTTYSTGAPMQSEASYAWRARDYSAIDADYRTGSVGGYRIDTGFVLQSKVIARNAYGQATEIEAPTVSGQRRSCVVYEGSRSLPTAQFTGTACLDAAAATAENGPAIGTLSLVQNNNWELAGTTFDSLQVLDGFYSFKVTDHYGPTRNLKLSEFGRLGYDFVISGWAYSTSSEKPMLVAEFRKADGTILSVQGAFDPIELFQPKKWQRWELVLTAKQLRESGLFAGSNAAGNYLRIWMGTGEPKGNSSRVVYIDNLVAYPSSASFALTTYRKDGQVLSSTNSRHETVRPIYDRNNSQRTGRDSKGRIFQDNAVHYLHENEGN